MKISLIVAMANHRVIGKGNALPWHLPADLRHFKATTMGHPIIMGRKTHESIGRPLPGRTNIVVTHKRDFRAEGCVVVHSLHEALQAAGEADEVFIMGGASLYEQALPLADRIYLTRIDADIDGDTYFPEIDWTEWQEIERQAFQPDAKNPHAYSFLIIERRR